MYDSSSYVNPTPLAHTDTSRDVLPRGGTSHMYVCFGAPWVLNFCLWMTTPVLTVQNCRRMPSIGGYHPYGLASILTGFESNRTYVGYAWQMNCSPSTPSHLSTGTSEGIA
ncbi:nibrin [Trichonephila clavipes]|nr:nibrin [Trichonephila clavipes]